MTYTVMHLMVTSAEKNVRMGRYTTLILQVFSTNSFVAALPSKYSVCRAVKAVTQSSLLHNLHQEKHISLVTRQK